MGAKIGFVVWLPRLPDQASQKRISKLGIGRPTASGIAKSLHYAFINITS